MTTFGRLRVRDRDVDASSGAAAQSGVAVTLTAAVGAVAIVTEHSTELVSDVGATVETPRGTGRLPGVDAHPNHPADRLRNSHDGVGPQLEPSSTSNSLANFVRENRG